MQIKKELLPLGSVVKTKTYKNKVIIFERDMLLKGKDFYDYGAALYPLGVYKAKMLYFQAEDIEKVYFKGYQDEKDIDYIKNIYEANKDISEKEYVKKNWTLKEKILTFLHIY